MADDRDALKARFATLGPAQNLPPPLPNGSAPIPINDVLSESPNSPVMRPGFDRIMLKVRRNQTRKYGVAGFSVHFIAELSPEAAKAVRHYGLGSAVLFQKELRLKLTFNQWLMIWRVIWLWLTRKKWRITVNDLVAGRTMTAKDVVEMLEIEADIRKAADIFAQVLRAASTFGGEEVIEL